MRWGSMLAAVTLLIAATVAPAMAVAGAIVVVGGTFVLFFPSAGLALLLATVVANAANVVTNVHGLPIFGVLIVPALAAVALIGKLRNGEETSIEQLVVVVAVAYVVLRSISLFWTEAPEATFLALNQLVKDWAIVLLIVAFVKSPRELRLAVRTVACTGGAIAFLGAVQYATGAFDYNFFGFANASVKQIAGDLHSWRLSGPYPDSNYFGQVLVMALPLALGTAIANSRLGLRIVGLASAAAILAAIVLTFSRGALGAVAVMAIVTILTLRARWRVLIPLCAAALIGVATAPQEFLDRFGSIAQAGRALFLGDQAIEDPSLGGRIAVMTAALDMFADYPLLGIGFAQYESVYGDYALAKGLDPGAPPHAHSLYLEMAAEGGLLGLVTFVALAGGAAAIALWGTARFKADDRSGSAVLGLSVVIGFVGYLTTSLFLHDAFPRLFYLEIGLLLSVGRVALDRQGTDLQFRVPFGRDLMNPTPRHHPFPPVDIVALLWQLRLTIILFAVIGAFLAGLYATTSPREYLAESTLLYRFGREYSPVAPGEQGRNWGESIQVSLDTALFTEMRLLKDREVLKEVARTIGPEKLMPNTRTSMLGLADVATTVGSWIMPPNDHNASAPVDEIAAATRALAATLVVRRVEGAAMLTVGFRHADSRIAEQIVDAVVAAYRAKRRELFNRNAADFYAVQIENIQAQLNAVQAEKIGILNARGVTEVGAERSISAERLLRLKQQAMLQPTNEELSGRIAETRQAIVDLDALGSQIEVLEIRRNAAAVNLSRLIDIRDRWAIDANYLDAVDPTAEIVESAADNAAPVGVSLALRIVLGAAFGVISGIVYVLFSALSRRRPVVAVEPGGACR
ncbi:MAG: O-antigen ligase family protein [Candidatus Kaistia colombiensis]|nr:MAG: O-antigen ligase family protein [Kaistia sp.]